MNSNKSVAVCIKSKFDLEQWLSDERLTLLVLDEIFMDPLSKDDEEDQLEEDSSDSAEYLPELDKQASHEVTDTHNEPVRSASDQSFGFIELVVLDFVVDAAVFQAVLLFLFSSF